MRKYVSKIAAVVLLSMATGHVQAAESSQEKDNIKAQLKAQFPQFAVENVVESPIPGFYEVNSGPIIIYVSKDGRFVFSGDIIDLQQGAQNIAEQARKKARIAALEKLPQKDKIIFSPKDPKYTVTVFTDVDCGYCRKFQNDVEELNKKGVAVQYLAFPRNGPNTPTFENMVKVWCSKDKAKAMSDAKQGKPIEGEVCEDNPILKELQLGVQLGISGTPTIVLENGTVLPGYVPPDKLLEFIKNNKN